MLGERKSDQVFISKSDPSVFRFPPQRIIDIMFVIDNILRKTKSDTLFLTEYILFMISQMIIIIIKLSYSTVEMKREYVVFVQQ